VAGKLLIAAAKELRDVKDAAAQAASEATKLLDTTKKQLLQMTARLERFKMAARLADATMTEHGNERAAPCRHPPATDYTICGQSRGR
jgi:hypothetical protein